MSERVTAINGKSVQVGLPVEAPEAEIVGREQEMNKVLAAWLGGPADMPLSPLLVGAPGVGKNRIVYACSRLCESQLYILQGHEDVGADELVCSVRISDDRARQMDYILSPLASAMVAGGTCFIDEIGKIRPRALAPLSSLLDERRYLDSTLLGERIYAHPGFRLVAATNTSDLEQNRLPDFLRSRLRPVISVGFPERKEVDAILAARFTKRIGEDRGALLDLFWDLWRERHGEQPPSPRDSLQIFGYAQKLADFEASDRAAGRVSLTGGKLSAPLLPDHLSRAFATFHEVGAERAP